MQTDVLFPVFDPDHPYILDKRGRIRDHIAYMSVRLATMFDWQGLPDTIPQRCLEYLLQINGNACIFSFEGSIYATYGGLGGEPDYNYEPTLYTIANPALDYSAELKIGTDCVRMRGDTYGYGLLPMHERYASQMVENDISIRTMMVNYRMGRGIVADNDRAYESAKEFLKAFEEGRLAAISSDEFFEGVHALEQNASGANIKDLIEVEQYLKASWYNEVGLNSNYNMKRERIMASESQMVDDALLPLVDDMLESRRRGCEEVNALFGTEWSVDLAGAWLKEHLKQSVQGADFDSDGDANIDEEVTEDVGADSDITDGTDGVDGVPDSDMGRHTEDDGRGLEETEETQEAEDADAADVVLDIDISVGDDADVTIEETSEDDADADADADEEDEEGDEDAQEESD